MSTLKSLTRKLADLLSRKDLEVSKFQETQKKLTVLNKEIKETQSHIDKFKQGDPTVSEHAILRYLERVEGVNIGAIISKILHPKILEYSKTLGSGSFPHPEGFKVVIRDNVITTIIAD